MAPSRAAIDPVQTALLAGAVLAFLPTTARGHPHHDAADIDPNVPIDAALYLHIGLQMLSWGILFPLGAVLGLTRSRWHVPLQTLATAITVVATQLGHHHGGRQFPSTAHAGFAGFLTWYLLTQVGCGVFLKLHVWEGTITRRTVQIVHGLLGKAFMVVAWVQMVLGFIAALGFCFGEHTGQCLAHFIMGSSFIAYGILLLISLHFGGPWLKRRGFSQEFFDSAVIGAWGLVNTFTEHGVFFSHGWHWNSRDKQHSAMGAFWWVGGMLSTFLCRGRKRNPIPGVIIFVTGWAFGSHEQSLMFSTVVHRVFGYTLMAAGLAKVIEACFVRPDDRQDDEGIKPFEHLTPVLLAVSGVCFMSATEEQLEWMVNGPQLDHVTYALLQYSVAFLIYFWANILVWVYSNSGRNAAPPLASTNGHANGGVANGDGGRTAFWRKWLSAAEGASPRDRDRGYEALPLRTSVAGDEEATPRPDVVGEHRPPHAPAVRGRAETREGETVWDAEAYLEEGEDAGFWHGQEDAKEYH